MMGIQLQCAIMIRGRERISLVVICRLGLSVALKSMHSSSSDGSNIACLHPLFGCRSIGAFYFEKEIRCDWISVFRRRDDLVIQVLPDSSVDLLWPCSPALQVVLLVFEPVVPT